LHRRSGTTSSRSRTASRPRCAPSRSELLTKPRSTGRRPRSARPHVTPMRSRAPRNDPTPADSTRVRNGPGPPACWVQADDY